MLLLRLCQFWNCLPDDLVGRDVILLSELMELDAVARIAEQVGRDMGSMSAKDVLFYRWIEEQREADTKLHGKLGVVDPDWRPEELVHDG